MEARAAGESDRHPSCRHGRVPLYGGVKPAAHDYRLAIERFPTYPAAFVALSAVLQRAGKGDESRKLLRKVVDGTVPTQHEPWWLYLVDLPSDTVSRLELLREEARR